MYCIARRPCVCVSAEPRLHAALVSAAKVTRCIQCSLVFIYVYNYYETPQPVRLYQTDLVKQIETVMKEICKK